MKQLCLVALLLAAVQPVWTQVAFDDPISLREGLDDIGVRGASITTINGNNIYVFWNDSSAIPMERGRLYFSRSTDGGYTFEKPRIVYNEFALPRPRAAIARGK